MVHRFVVCDLTSNDGWSLGENEGSTLGISEGYSYV